MLLLQLVEPDKGKSKFCQILHNDIVDLLVKFDKAIKQLESMMSKKITEAALKKLASELPALESAMDEAFTMGKNFGYELKGAGPKGTKKKRKMPA